MKMLYLIALFQISLFSQENYSIKPYSEIKFPDIKEGSALLKSKTYKDVFWTLNDSGNPAIIYPLNSKGEIIKPNWTKNYKGIKILDAVNIDWEWMTLDDEGNIYIGDTGNNYNYRKDLAVYKISEPNPYYAIESGIIAKYLIKYPDQKEFPPDENNFNFDAEAGYFYNNALYIISKNRSNTLAKIYKFSNLKPFEVNIGEIVSTFNFESMVTDASLSEDKKYLAVLTYDYIWLFERNEKDDNFFNGKNWKKKISLGQCEGIAFDGDKLIISNEEGKLFSIKLEEIKTK